MTTPIETLVARAQEGDRAALEAVIAGVRDRIYNLALRMLWHPADAEDATQEILVRHRHPPRLVPRRERVYHLGLPRGLELPPHHPQAPGRARGVDIRALRRTARRGAGAGCARSCGRGGEPVAGRGGQARLLQGMLLCLDRDHRLAYILGDVFGVTSQEAAEIVGISPVALSQAALPGTGRLHGFMERKCGLVNPDNPCRCARRVEHAVRVGRVDPDQLLFATHPVRLEPDAADATRSCRRWISSTVPLICSAAIPTTRRRGRRPRSSAGCSTGRRGCACWRAERTAGEANPPP